MKQFSSPDRAGGFRALANRYALTFVALGWLATLVQAEGRTWTGASSGNWSNPDNWDPVGVPQNGDTLVFTGDGSNTSMVNDLVGLMVNLMSFAEQDYELSGNTLTITNPIDSLYNGHSFVVGNPSFTTTINCPLDFPNGGQITTGHGVGILTETTEDMYLNGEITISGGSLYFFAYADDLRAGANGHIHVASVISGNTNVWAFAEDAGGHVSTISFDGAANTFSGTLYLGASGNAEITFNKSSGAVATNRVVVSYGRSVRLNLAGPNQIGNDAVIEIDAGSQLLLSGNNVGVGSLVFSNYSADAVASTLDTGSVLVGINNSVAAWVGNDHVHPTIKGRLNLVGYAQFNISGGPEPGLEILATVGGNGFQKFGTGTLRLNGNNTYFGDVEAIEGTIEALTPTAFGQAGPTYGVHLEGGNLTLQGVSIGAEPLFVNSAVSFLTAINQCSWAGPVTLNTDFNVVPLDVTGSGLKLNFSGSISGSGGLNLQPALFGVGNVQLSGPAGNLFTGPTTVNCQLLELNKSSGVNAFAGPLIVGGSSGSALHEARWLQSYQNIGATATLYANGVINLNNHNEDFGPVTFNGGEVDTGTGQFAIYAPLTVNPAATSAVINGYFGLPPGADRNFVVGDGASDCDLLVNAVVFGSPGTYFVKQGAGTMCMANANTYNAPTLLEEGILDINNDAGLGTWPGLIIFNGATLRISGPGNAGGGVEVLGTGVGGTHGAIEVLPGNGFGISGNVLLDASTTLNLGGTLGLNGLVSGNGPLIKTGAGALVFGGGANNTYSGDTVVSSGSLLMAKSANKISVPGNLIIGPGPATPTTFARLFQAGGLGGTMVTVNANSLFDLNGYYQSLTTLNLRDGGRVQTGAGLLDFPNGGAINVGSLNMFGSHVSASITGVIGLPANVSLSFNVSPYAPSFPFASGPELEVLATIPRPAENLGFAPAGIAKNGLGQMRLSGNNTYAGSTAINDGTLFVDGTQPQSLVAVNRGTLGGSGTVGDIYMTGSAAVVAPGDNGPGILTCGNVNAGITASGVLRMELNGTTPGSGYDQLNVIGTVNVAGITLERPLGFTPPTGAQFQIINNDGRDLVTGAFNGLPGGGKLYIGGVIYQINYGFGGRLGNDVALQGLDTPLPPPPTLTIQRLPPASVRLLWPVSDPPFDLQTCTNLTAASWANALPPPTVNGTNNIVTNPTSNTQQFYRLISP